MTSPNQAYEQAVEQWKAIACPAKWRNIYCERVTGHPGEHCHHGEGFHIAWTDIAWTDD